jgi:hypothetical protein
MRPTIILLMAPLLNSGDACSADPDQVPADNGGPALMGRKHGSLPGQGIPLAETTRAWQ